MSQTLPTHCGRGHCPREAVSVVHIDYPQNPVTGQRPFRWSKPMCDRCEEIERVGAQFTHAVVSTSPLSALAVTQ